MMKPAATFLLLLMFSCLCLGQKNDKQKVSVIWGSEPGCHPNNTQEIKALEPECAIVVVDNLTFRIVTVGGVSYAMSNRPVRDFLVASVQIANKSESPIQLSPNRSRLAIFKTAEDYAADAKPALHYAQSQDDLRQAAYRESTVTGEKDGEIRSGLRVRERNEDVTSRGQIVSRTTILEPAAPQTENPAASIVTNSLLVPRAVFDYILKSKSLPAGEKAAGHLVFKNLDEVKGYRVLYLNAGSIEFVFPEVSKQ